MKEITLWLVCTLAVLICVQYASVVVVMSWECGPAQDEALEALSRVFSSALPGVCALVGAALAGARRVRASQAA